MDVLNGSIRGTMLPFRWLLDVFRSTAPILRREFLGILRTRRAFWMTVLTVAAASLVPLLGWPTGESATAFQIAGVAVSVYLQSFRLALFLFVPVVTASAITVERERGTHEMLYNSLIRPSGIVLGKLLAATGYFLLLLALTSPMVCLLYLLGGLEMAGMAGMFVGLAIHVVFFGLVGLWCSMRSERTARAIILAFALVILYLVLDMLATNLFFRYVDRSSGLMSWYPLISLAIPGLLSPVLYLSLVRGARFPDHPASRRRERRSPGDGGGRRRGATRPFSPVAIHILRRCHDGIPSHWNPVFVSTLRSDILGLRRGGRLLILLAVLLLVGVLAFLALLAYQRGARSLNIQDSLMAISSVILFGLTFLVPGLAANAVSSEQSLERLDLLRGTPLTARVILSGKSLAILFACAEVLFLGLVLCGLPYWLGAVLGRDTRDWRPRPQFPLLNFLLSTVAIFFQATSAGVLAAAIFRRSVAALLFSYALAVGVLLVIPLLTAWLLEEAGSARRLARAMSPLLEFLSFDERDGESGFYFFLSTAIAFSLTFLQYFIAVGVFGRWRMRDR